MMRLRLLLRTRAPLQTTSTRLNYYWYYPQQHFSSSSRKRRQHEKNLQLDENKNNPFRVLNVKRSDSYGFIKKQFLKIAMEHHPDTNTDTSATTQLQHKEIFMAAREAFEQIVESSDGKVMLKSECDDYKETDNVEAWFQQETGHDMPFMDQKTMKEVAEMTDKVGGGLDRDGGMWTLAKMVTNAVHTGGNANDVLRLEAGTIRDREINGVLRRRRNR